MSDFNANSPSLSQWVAPIVPPLSFSLRILLKFCIVVTKLREGSGYQIGWIFGKIPNGNWPPLIFGKLCCNFFYNGYGCIYARRYEGQIVWNACTCLLQSVSYFDSSQYNPWTLNLLFLYQFHAQKVPKICNIDFWIENAPPPPLELFQKFTRFGSVARP